MLLLNIIVFVGMIYFISIGLIYFSVMLANKIK